MVGVTKKKLLFISASIGAGHVRAAEALKTTAEQQFPTLSVEHIDMLVAMTRPMRRIVVDSYNLLVKRLPELWGLFYDKTNNERRSGNLRELARLLHTLNPEPLYRALEAFGPDYILCTHFLPLSLLLQPAKKPRAACPVSVVVTDYDIHAAWIVPGATEYFVATDKIRWKITRTEAAARGTISGIPVDPTFYEPKSTAALKNKYNLPPKKILLLLSGGYGILRHDTLVAQALLKGSQPLHLIIIAGKNKKLERKLQALRPPPHITLSVIGWTDRIDEYMRVADAVVSKPGGLTTSECIALKKPLIAFEPIPGQEECNGQFILERQFGVVARTPLDLLYYSTLAPNELAPGHKQAEKMEKTSAQIILERITQSLA